jgi:hypothetical protein
MAAKLMPVMAALQDWLRVGKEFSTVWIRKTDRRLPPEAVKLLMTPDPCFFYQRLEQML